ncbi:AraC family transcriptional regulator [Rhizobium sp. 0TCS1.26]|uniref:helix-turn-helix domain-containing protein n=1 Tax=Rhizobium sp. 0TCS1.26 TaxID=3142623 RepID=UPI003D29DFBE
MATSAAAYTQDAFQLQFAVQPAASNEISRLLMKAIDTIEHDETVAIDFIRKASALLRPATRESRPESRRPISLGGLAPWQVNRVTRLIEERIAGSISLDELAQAAKLSTSYFSAAFKVSFGISPHSYILSRRVEHAKHRMLHSNSPLCEIALDCGMADQAHLSRVFRRVTGTTPSAWRRYRVNPDAAIVQAG